MRTLLVILALVTLVGCDQQPVELPVLEVVGATVVPEKPTWDVKKSDSKGVSVLKWKAVVTNADNKDATDLLISVLDVNNKVIAADMIKVAVKPGETKTLNGIIDIIDADVFRINRITVFLVCLENK